MRALRGRALRVEVFSRDGSPEEAHAYTVAESSFQVRLLQPRIEESNTYAAFLVHERETLSYHYERDPADPRVSHSAVLEVDDFGNVLRSAQIAYPRPDTQASMSEQEATSIVYTETDVINAELVSSYRLGVPYEARSYELHGLTGDPKAPFSLAALLAHADSATEIAYETAPGVGAKKRLLSRVQSYYYSDDLAQRLALGSCGTRALPYETLTLAFTAAQLTTVFGRRIHTTRPHNDPLLREVQDLRYHYDPSGNITQIRDKAQQGVFFDNAYVSPEQVFTYDPLYRLIEAEGREHDTLSQPTATGFTPISHPQNTQAQRRYVQSYVYDKVGNITRMKHISGGVTQWHRGYHYPTGGNRLLKTSIPGDDINDELNYTADYNYDDHGSMIAIDSIPGGLTWDPQDRLQKTEHLGGGDVYYVYDSAGMRVRKVCVNQNATASKERFYLGPWETYRETTDPQGTPTLDLERETLHVDDTAGAACLIETKTVASGSVIGNPTSHLRYQHTNHLGTATLELTGSAEVISYEEYHPYGTSAYRAANGSVDVSAKRYRYTGKERDEETGLYYHEARYYACWLGRWCSTDPVGVQGGFNTYEYAESQPNSLVDGTGTTAEEPELTRTIVVNGGARVRAPIVDLLAAGRAEGVGSPTHATRKDAAKHASVVGTAFAEADERLYLRELASTRSRASRAARAHEQFGGSALHEPRGVPRRNARKARKNTRVLMRESQKNESLKVRERKLRGHLVEWESEQTDGNKAFGFTTPQPGEASSYNPKTGAYRQGSLPPPNVLEMRAAGIEETGSKIMHSHPISGDPAQSTLQLSSQSGLLPTDPEDLNIISASGTDYLTTPRGGVLEYGKEGVVRELSPDLDPSDFPEGANLQVEAAKLLSSPQGFEDEVDRATRVLQKINRQELSGLQRGT